MFVSLTDCHSGKFVFAKAGMLVSNSRRFAEADVFQNSGLFFNKYFFYTCRCLLSCVLGVMAFVKFFTLEGVWPRRAYI